MKAIIMVRTLLVLVLTAGSLWAADPPPAAVDGILVTCHGKLRSGVMAVGGETTGTTVTFSNGVVWELKLPDMATKRFAEQHHKDDVTVTGRLKKVSGVAIPLHWIVDVEQIVLANKNGPMNTATFTLKGKLRSAAKGAPGVIEIGKDPWPVEWKNDPQLHQQATQHAGQAVEVHGQIERNPDFSAPIPAIFRIEKLQAPRS